MRGNFNKRGTGVVGVQYKPKGLDYFLISNKLIAEKNKLAMQTASGIDFNTLGIDQGDMPKVEAMTKNITDAKNKTIEKLLDGKDLSSSDVRKLAGNFLKAKDVNKGIMEAKKNYAAISKSRDFFTNAGFTRPRQKEYFDNVFKASYDKWNQKGGTFGEGTINDMGGDDQEAMRIHLGKSSSINFKSKKGEDGRIIRYVEVKKPSTRIDNFEAIQEIVDDYNALLSDPNSRESRYIDFIEQGRGNDGSFLNEIQTEISQVADDFKRSRMVGGESTVSNVKYDPITQKPTNPLLQAIRPGETRQDIFNQPYNSSIGDVTLRSADDKVVDVTDSGPTVIPAYTGVPGVIPGIGKTKDVGEINKSINNLYRAAFTGSDAWKDQKFSILKIDNLEHAVTGATSITDTKVVPAFLQKAVSEEPITYKNLRDDITELRSYVDAETPIYHLQQDSKKVRNLKDNINKGMSKLYNNYLNTVVKSEYRVQTIDNININTATNADGTPKGKEVMLHPKIKQAIANNLDNLQVISFKTTNGGIEEVDASQLKDNNKRGTSANTLFNTNINHALKLMLNGESVQGKGEGKWKLSPNDIGKLEEGVQISNFLNPGYFSGDKAAQKAKIDVAMSDAIDIEIYNDKTGETRTVLVENNVIPSESRVTPVYTQSRNESPKKGGTVIDAVIAEAQVGEGPVSISTPISYMDDKFKHPDGLQEVATVEKINTGIYEITINPKYVSGTQTTWVTGPNADGTTIDLGPRLNAITRIVQQLEYNARLQTSANLSKK
jgi:hypothetical protein